ncbi:MAG: hypothetical protein JNM04_01905 [Chthonomonas sp.]|nr:hypothetical protein [Chthonomonas sp.]
MKCTLKNLSILGMIALVGAANAQIDGSYKAAYGSPIVLQDTQTNFGDSNTGLQFSANGNELNAAYAYRDASDLYLFFPGNLATDYTSFELFIDSRAGGQNRITATNSGISFGKLRRMGDDGSGNGLKFDNAFSADYFFHMNGGGDTYTAYLDCAIIGNNVGEVGDNRYNQGGFWLGSSPGFGTMNAGQVNSGLGVGVNMSNTAGVEAGTGLSTLANTGLATGLEFRIPLSMIGATPTSALRVCAFVNGQGADYVSNQVMGGLGGSDNLGDPRNIDFSSIAGDQFFTVPATNSAYRTISGKFKLGDLTGTYVPGNPQPVVEMELRDSGGTKIRDLMVSVEPDQSYSVTVPAGNYQLSFKPRKCLRKNINVDVTSGNVTNADVVCLLGNIKYDGIINTDDYLALSGFFDMSDGVEYDQAWNDWRNWNNDLQACPSWCDLNYNGIIDTDDYLFLSNNFDNADE